MKPATLQLSVSDHEESLILSRSLSLCPDYKYHSEECVRIWGPLHTGSTQQNIILIKTFCKLLTREVAANIGIQLDPNVINIIVLYTFERTHSIIPHERIETCTSLSREGDILDSLTRCELQFKPNTSKDYILKGLIGHVLYGFDIHDSPYNGVNDPNPLEIITSDGAMYLVPDKLSDWFLNQDDECIALPMRYRFKHRISDARIMGRVSGPYLQLTIAPSRGTLPQADEELKMDMQESPSLALDSELSLDMDISDCSSMKSSRSSTADTLALEIANSWENPVENMVLVVPHVLHRATPIMDDACKGDKFVRQTRVLNEPYVGLSLSDTVMSHLACSMSVSNNKWLDNEIKQNFQHQEAKCGSDRENSVFTNTENSTSSTLCRSIPTFGTCHTSAPLHESELTLHCPGERDEHISYASKTMRIPSIVTHNFQKPVVLEIGAGLVGIRDLSLSLHHNKTTPNPSDSSDSFDFELDIGE